jgi:Acetoacetate decarboxylase (ADC)
MLGRAGQTGALHIADPGQTTPDSRRRYQDPGRSVMAQRISDNAWKIEGRTVSLPVRIRDSTVAAAVYCCCAETARAAITDDRLEPLTVAGRGIAILFFARYHDSDLGIYDEVGVTIAVCGPGREPIGFHIVELPVTQTFTLEAGRAIWGLPKWLARSIPTSRQSGPEVHLYDGDDFVLTAALDKGRLRIPVPVTAPVVLWAVQPDGPDRGELLHGTFRLRLADLRVRPGGTRLVIGEHRMSRTARALGMSHRPLCTVVARVSAELGPLMPVQR